MSSLTKVIVENNYHDPAMGESGGIFEKTQALLPNVEVITVRK